MLDCKHKQHRHGRPQKNSTGRQSRHFGCPLFQAADDANANRRSHNTLPFLHHKENDPHCGNSPKNCASFAAMLLFTPYKTRWQQYFFSVFTPYKCFISHRDLLLSAVAVSLHHLPQMSAFNSHMQQNACCRNLSEPLFPCYCYAMKASFTI